MLFEAVATHPARFVMGAIAIAVTLLFGFIVNPHGAEGGVVTTISLVCGILTGFTIARPRRLRRTSLPYLFKTGFGVSIAVLGIGHLVHSENPQYVYSIPATICGTVFALFVTAKTKQLRPRKS